MNNPKVIQNVKLLFHALTVAQAALAALAGIIPQKYAVYGLLLTSAISAGLNILTRLFPELVVVEGK